MNYVFRNETSESFGVLRSGNNGIFPKTNHKFGNENVAPTPVVKNQSGLEVLENPEFDDPIQRNVITLFLQ